MICAIAQRLGVQQAVAWFGPEVRINRVTGQPTFQLESGSLQQSH